MPVLYGELKFEKPKHVKKTALLELLGYETTDARNKIDKFSIKYSSKTVWLSIKFFVGNIMHVVAEKKVFLIHL